MSQKYEKLKALLKELFQLDQPDLDFGLYRVMHAKSTEVSQFLDKDLLPQVQAAFGQYKTADKAEIEKELVKVIAGIEAAGMDPAQSPKVNELRARLKSDAVDVGALESEVYDRLFGFFRRYYSEGDFLAKRVYKPGVYAIPYEGEEVTLHWANKDQYYIKTSEYLRDYAFRLRPDDDKKPMRSHFRLADATEGEHGNLKAAEGKVRVFILAAPGDSGLDFITEEDGEQGKELVIHFEYRPATINDWPEEAREGKNKPPAQKDLSAHAVKRVLAATNASFAVWIAELGKPHVTASGEKADYTRLEGHLKRYTARNTFDYFIHKDLGGFLRRELDFYIKNEVMHLDDVENETAPRVEQYLSKIKVIRKIAGKIIDFLAQLEDFQKKLWLKKKFVVETQYCITLGCIPEALYPEIAANNSQREEWVRLFAIDEMIGDLATHRYSAPLTVEFLKAHPTFVMDTQHFDAYFTARLLEAIGDVDELTDGVLFHSENFQVLSLMQARYREQVKCIYIDPPYNTGGDEFSYKDNYQHSSWISMCFDRLSKGINLIQDDGLIFVSIDESEITNLRMLITTLVGNQSITGEFVWKKRAGGDMSAGRGIGLAMEHEYVVTAAKTHDAKYRGSEKGNSNFSNPDNDPEGLWTTQDLTCNKTREERPSLYYDLVDPANGNVFKCSQTRVWSYEKEKMEGMIRRTVNGRHLPKVIFPNSPDQKPKLKKFLWERKSDFSPISSWLENKESNSNISGVTSGYAPLNSVATREFSALFGEKPFMFPKSVGLIKTFIEQSVSEKDVSLDFFAGSGTTGHAIINLNREDGGRRRFLLVEMGDYFDKVLLTRIKKVTFTPEWKDGKPKRLATPEEAERSPRIIKVVRLESYEDTLNNLETRRTETQQLLLNTPAAQGTGGLKEQYLLRYMLDVETRGSQSLLNVQAFTDPTAYKLKVKRPGSDESREVNVDLLETFNWLIGLTVQHIAAPQSFSAAFECDSERRLRLKGRLKQEADGPYRFRTVTGTMPDGRKTLIIWRKLTGEPEQDNLVLDEWFTKQGYSAKDSEFDLIYVNGDNNLETLKAPDDTWKVRLIEEDFYRLMFETEGV